MTVSVHGTGTAVVLLDCVLDVLSNTTQGVSVVSSTRVSSELTKYTTALTEHVTLSCSRDELCECSNLTLVDLRHHFLGRNIAEVDVNTRKKTIQNQQSTPYIVVIRRSTKPEAETGQSDVIIMTSA